MAKMPKPKIRTADLAKKSLKMGKRISLPKKAPAKKGIISRLSRYLRESRLELKKVAWPSRQEVFASAVVVLVMVIIFSLFIGGLDFLLVKLIKVVTFKF